MSSTRLTVHAVWSDNSDFTELKQAQRVTVSSTADTLRKEWEGVSAATSGTTLDLGEFTTITRIVITNKDTSNFITAEYYWQYGSQGADDWDFAANDTPETITDNSANGTLVTNGSVAGRYVRIAAAEDTGNNGVYLIDSTTTDVITLAAGGGTLTTDNVNDTTATLSFEEKVKAKIIAGDTHIGASLEPGADLILTADTAACLCDVTVWGT